MLRTYGSEDCEGKETTLDVVPVVGEVFRDDVDPGVLSIATHLLVLSQGIRHLLQHKLSGRTPNQKSCRNRLKIYFYCLKRKRTK